MCTCVIPVQQVRVAGNALVLSLKDLVGFNEVSKQVFVDKFVMSA